MEDVALTAGVSRALVSIVFRDQPGAGNETRARVRAAAAEIGYWPDARAQLLSRKQTRLVGVSFAVGHEFHADLVTELYAAAQDSGYELVLSGVTPDRREQRAAQDLLAFRCDAVILPGPSTRLADLAAIGRQTPTVVLARAATAEGIDVVRTDDVRGFVDNTQGVDLWSLCSTTRTFCRARRRSLSCAIELMRGCARPTTPPQ